ARADGGASLAGGERPGWREYARRSDRVARPLVDLGLARGDRVAVLLPDGPGVHAAWVAVEKAGMVTVGIGPRAGPLEVAHLLRRSGARALVSHAAHRDLDFAAILASLRAEGAPLPHQVVVDGELEAPGAFEPVDAARRLSP